MVPTHLLGVSGIFRGNFRKGVTEDDAAGWEVAAGSTSNLCFVFVNNNAAAEERAFFPEEAKTQ